MFRDRIFNLSILFSCAWHLCWISVIGVVVTPSVQPSDFYQEVNFLGPILEKTAFDLMVEGAKPQAETLYARSTLFIDNIYLKPKGPELFMDKEYILYAIGLLGQSEPEKAIRLARKYLKKIERC